MEGNYVFIALILLVKQGINSVHIVQIEGPEVLKAGAELRLDCDYDSSYLNVSCAVTGVHPSPLIDLSWTNNASSEHMERMDTVVRTQPSGLLDVTVSSVLPRDVFTADLVIACEVTIPNTPHYTREELTTFTQSMLTSRYTSGGKELKSSVTISSLFLVTLLTLLQ